MDEINKPPIFKSWGQLYAFVIGMLIVEIVLFYTLSNQW